MSTGNAAAMIGLANTNKIPMIGGYKQANPNKWGAAGPYDGVNGEVFWNRNVLGEAIGFVAPSAEAAAAGKNAQWVTSTVGLAAATTRVNLTAGDAVANAAGTHNVYGVPAVGGIPANSFFWVFER